LASKDAREEVSRLSQKLAVVGKPSKDEALHSKVGELEQDMRLLCENVINDVEYLELRLVEALKISCTHEEVQSLKDRMTRFELCLGDVSAHLTPSRDFKDEEEDSHAHTPSTQQRGWRQEN